MKKILAFFATKTGIIIAVGAGIAILAFVIFGRNAKPPEYSSEKVQKIDLVQSVSETGKLTSDNEVTYGWEISGRVASVNHQVGDVVNTGDSIAALDSSQQIFGLNQARASLAGAQASLNLKITGPSNEQINQSGASVDKAKAALEKTKTTADAAINNAGRAVETAKNNLQKISDEGQSFITQHAYNDLIDTIRSADTVMNDALKKADDILGIDNKQANDSYEVDLGAQNPSTYATAKLNYDTAKTAKFAAETALNGLVNSPASLLIESVAKTMQMAVGKTQTVLRNVQATLLATPTTNLLTLTSLNSLQSSINIALTSVDATATKITASIQGVDTAKNSLAAYQIAYDKALNDLENTKKQTIADIRSAESALNETSSAHASLIAKPREVDIASLRAEILRQNALVADAANQLTKTNLIAAATGTISHLDLKVGQTITANSPAVTILSKQLRIDVDISESDIAKLKINNSITATLDAFGEEVKFTGHVFSIEPAQTEISGVVYYKTKLILDTLDNYEPRPGMTANVRIVTDTKNSSIVIPQRAIIEKNGKKIVRVLLDKKTAKFEEHEVTTGLRGDDGKIEITSGLNENDEVITFLKETL